MPLEPISERKEAGQLWMGWRERDLERRESENENLPLSYIWSGGLLLCGV